MLGCPFLLQGLSALFLSELCCCRRRRRYHGSRRRRRGGGGDGGADNGDERASSSSRSSSPLTLFLPSSSLALTQVAVVRARFGCGGGEGSPISLEAVAVRFLAAPRSSALLGRRLAERRSVVCARGALQPARAAVERREEDKANKLRHSEHRRLATQKKDTGGTHDSVGGHVGAAGATRSAQDGRRGRRGGPGGPRGTSRPPARPPRALRTFAVSLHCNLGLVRRAACP